MRLLDKIKRELRRPFRRQPANLDDFLKSCASIVHVGANSGQERDAYAAAGLKVVWVEPIPALYAQLVANIAAYPDQSAIQALLTDRAGEQLTLNVSNNQGASSSIFDFALHKDIWPDVHYVDRIAMRSETLDGLYAAGRLPARIDAVILDTQGAELLILKGGEAVLRQARFVKAEAADFESYAGGAKLDEIVAFLRPLGFRLRAKRQFSEHPRGGRYYDAVFARTAGA